MFELLLSITMTVLLYLNFRYFPKIGVDTLQAIVINYGVCVFTGLLFKPQTLQDFISQDKSGWLWAGIFQGFMFIAVFVLVGRCTQTMGMAVSSLVSKISMVIPVAFSLFIFQSHTPINFFKIVGIILALGALVLISTKKQKQHSEAKETVKNKTFHWKGLMLTVAVFFGSGTIDSFTNFVNNSVITEQQTSQFTISVFLFAFLFGSIYLIYQIITARALLQFKSIVGGITLGIPNFFAYYFMLRALSVFNNDGSLIFPLANISVILISTIIGMLVFHEKLSPANKVGVALAMLSIAVLAYS
jgi:drug/metabolite transporter (DMT)-like permease